MSQCNIEIILLLFFSYLGEHIKNWRPRYFILLDNGALIGFKSKPEHGFDDPLNNFTVKGKLFSPNNYFNEACKNC